MTAFTFPPLELDAARATLDNLHQYTRALSAIRRALAPPQKHWAHISLRVNAAGLTTSPVPCGSTAFELALDLTTHRVLVATSRGETWSARLRGQPLSTFWRAVNDALAMFDIHPNATQPDYADAAPMYDPAAVERYWRALSQTDLLLKQFQGELRGETSPVQFWAHHFDLALLWLSGRRVPGQDPANEEFSDEQINFGFSIGDDSFAEPYFYVTAYPTPDGFVGSPLPDGAHWQTRGWQGAVLPYTTLTNAPAPEEFLLNFWRTVQTRGAELMRDE